MADNMRDMTLNLIVNSQVNKVKDFNKELKKTKDNIDDTTQKTGWLSKSLRRLFGTYLGIRGVQGIVKTYRSLDLMRRSIEGLTQSTEDWEYLTKEAFRTATDIEVVAKGYRNFYAAATMAGVDKSGVQNMYSNILEAGRAVGATQYQVEGALLALEQMFSKGKVSMEELRRQLGNALPGAFEVAAKAMGVTTQQFNEMIKSGIQAADLVPKFTAEYRKTFEKSFPAAMKSLDAAIVNLGTSWKLFQYDFMRSGAGTELAKVLVRVSQILQNNKLKTALQGLGYVLGQILGIIKFLIDNLGTVIFLLSPVMLGGLLDKIVALLKQAVAWIATGNVQLSATQVMLFRILVLLAGVQEIIAFFTPMDGALETAILGKDQSWIDRLKYLIGGLSSIYLMLDAILGFKMTKGLFSKLGNTKFVKNIKSWASIGKNATKVAEVTKEGTGLSKILKPSGQAFTNAEIDLMKKGVTTGSKTLGKGLFANVGLKGLGIAGWLATLGQVINLGNQNIAKLGINPMTVSPYGAALPFNFNAPMYNPPQLNKTETMAHTINYKPKYHIEANSMTPEQLRAVLDERDRNFWTSLTNPTARLMPNFLGGSQ